MATEMDVYKIAKAYVQTVIDTKNKKSILFEKPKPDVPEIIELAVNFVQSMKLLEMNGFQKSLGFNWLKKQLIEINLDFKRRKEGMNGEWK